MRPSLEDDALHYHTRWISSLQCSRNCSQRRTPQDGASIHADITMANPQSTPPPTTTTVANTNTNTNTNITVDGPQVVGQLQSPTTAQLQSQSQSQLQSQALVSGQSLTDFMGVAAVSNLPSFVQALAFSNRSRYWFIINNFRSYTRNKFHRKSKSNWNDPSTSHRCCYCCCYCSNQDRTPL